MMAPSWAFMPVDARQQPQRMDGGKEEQKHQQAASRPSTVDERGSSSAAAARPAHESAGGAPAERNEPRKAAARTDPSSNFGSFFDELLLPKANGSNVKVDASIAGTADTSVDSVPAGLPPPTRLFASAGAASGDSSGAPAAGNAPTGKGRNKQRPAVPHQQAQQATRGQPHWQQVPAAAGPAKQVGGRLAHPEGSRSDRRGAASSAAANRSEGPDWGKVFDDLLAFGKPRS